MNRQKQLSINLIASIIAFSISIGINFILTPYIIKNINVEAYGFISLGSQFINYASLATVALNSMASRFITIEIYKKNWEAANKYFFSVLLSNVIIATLMVIPSILCVIYLDNIVNVPVEILRDVQGLFAFLFANYLIGSIGSSFGVSTFATNKLYLNSQRETESTIIKTVLLVLLFSFLGPKIIYVGFTAFIATLYLAFFNIYYTKKLLPEIHYKKSYFDKHAVYEMISSGIWNTLVKTGQILQTGLDLLISNIYLNSTIMGTIAVSNSLSPTINILIATISGVFMPDFTKLYAEKNKIELIKSINQSMKIVGIIGNSFMVVLLVFSKEFFHLWVPTQDEVLLRNLFILSGSASLITIPMNPLYSIFTLTNRLKANALLLLTTGFLNITIVMLLLKTTNAGVYAIVGISSALMLIRNIFFTLPLSAKYLGLKWDSFLPAVLKTVEGSLITILVGVGINNVVNVNSWIMLIVAAGITGLLGLIISSCVILTDEERKYLLRTIRNKLKK